MTWLANAKAVPSPELTSIPDFIISSLQRKVLYSGLDLDWAPKRKKLCSLTNLWPYLWLEWSKAGGVGRGRASSVRDVSGTRDQKKAAARKPPNGYPFGLEKQGVSWGWSYLKTNSQWFPKSDHAGHRSIRVFNECSQRRGSWAMGSDRWRVSRAVGGGLYSRMKAPSCVSVDRLSPLKQSLCSE